MKTMESTAKGDMEEKLSTLTFILFQINLSVLLATCHQCALILLEISALYKLFTYLLTFLKDLEHVGVTWEECASGHA